ncbi:MAG: ATP-binding protein [Candidatus Omnitrophica bacterium]|nr:ATP-binding protein [Candidatus Omnitrophota bacterium]
MNLIHKFFQSNLDIVFFFYGLSFVVMGIAISVKPKKESSFELARILWLFAGFALIHGTNEFLDMWVIIKGTGKGLNIIRSSILVISYLFLFEFSRRFLRICRQKYIERITRLLNWWLTLIIILFIFILAFASIDFWKTGTIWARYLLGFPAGFLASFGFILYYKYEKERLEPLKVKKYFICASLFILGYGILGGLIVPKAGFFPASLLNVDSFLSLTHIPVQVLRTICVVIISWAICGILGIFDRETLEKLHRKINEYKFIEEKLIKTYEGLETHIQERTRELTKANESLKTEITERIKIAAQNEKLIKELKENQELFKRQKQDLEDSRRAIKNVAEDLAYSKEILEYQNKTLAEVNKELDDFTYIVSHDLKEPLRSIDAYSKFVIDDYRDKLDEEGRHYLERIRANAERMKRLIEDLLEISRLKKKGSVFEEVEVTELIAEVKMRLEYSIKQKGVEIVIKDKLPKIFCDRVRLTEAFLNLISNAIKFNDKPKPIIEIGFEDKEGFYEFYVRDNGIGIKEEYFDKIFEIFQRLGKREDNEGTGAGLTIVKKIVQLHKGKVWLESKPQEGTVFYFTIAKDRGVILGKKLIGEILLEKKMITEEDLKKALEDQHVTDRPNEGGENAGNT